MSRCTEPHEQTDIETRRYGISSFVYSARRPFHPKRLWELLEDSFCILQGTPDEEEEGEDEDQPDHDEADDMEVDDEEADEVTEPTKEQVRARLREEKEKMNLPAKVQFKRKSPLWKGVMRSKGFVWMATRPQVHGEWSQAGVSLLRADTGVKQADTAQVMFTMTGGGPWMCAVPEDEWPTDSDEIKEQIKSDFEGEWGDSEYPIHRPKIELKSAAGRQEGILKSDNATKLIAVVVFIGQSIDQTLLVDALDRALLNDSEWRMWERVSNATPRVLH